MWTKKETRRAVEQLLANPDFTKLIDRWRDRPLDAIEQDLGVMWSALNLFDARIQLQVRAEIFEASMPKLREPRK